MREMSAEFVEQLRKASEGIPAQSPGGGPGAVAVSALDAVLEMVFLMAAVDGEVSALEIAQFAEAVEEVLGAAPIGTSR